MDNYEENNPPSYPMDEILKKLKYFDKNISKNEVKFLYHGSYNVYQIKNKFILKILDKILVEMFGEQIIRDEARKLDYLKDKVLIPIPELIFLSEIPSDPFFIYEMLPGLSLSKIFTSLTKVQKDKIASEIGKIVTNLHLLAKKYPNLLKSLKMSLTFDDYCLSIQNLLSNSRNAVYLLLTKKEVDWIEDLFKSLFECVKKHPLT